MTIDEMIRQARAGNTAPVSVDDMINQARTELAPAATMGNLRTIESTMPIPEIKPPEKEWTDLPASFVREISDWAEKSGQSAVEVWEKIKAANQAPQGTDKTVNLDWGGVNIPVQQSAEQVAAMAEVDKAAGKFVQQAIVPPVYVGAVIPSPAQPFLGAAALGFMAKDLSDMIPDQIAQARKEQKEADIVPAELKGLGAAASQLFGIDSAQRALSDPAAFKQQFINAPIATTGEYVPAWITGRAIYKGGKGIVGRGAKSGEVTGKNMETPRPANESMNLPTEAAGVINDPVTGVVRLRTPQEIATNAVSPEIPVSPYVNAQQAVVLPSDKPAAEFVPMSPESSPRVIAPAGQNIVKAGNDRRYTPDDLIPATRQELLDSLRTQVENVARQRWDLATGENAPIKPPQPTPQPTAPQSPIQPLKPSATPSQYPAEVSRVIASISQPKPETMTQRLNAFTRKLVDNMTDDKAAVARIEKQIEAEKGRKLTPEESIVTQMRLANPRAAGETNMLLFGKNPEYLGMGADAAKAIQAIENNRPGVRLNPVTMADVFGQLKNAQEKTLLDSYSIAKQIPAIMREHPNMKITAPDGKPITLQEALNTQQYIEANHRNVVEAHRNMMAVAENAMNLNVADGLVSRATADMLREKYPDHVPFYRDMGPLEVEGHFNKGGGFFNVPSTIQSYVGSNRAILSPVESVMMNIVRDRSRGNRNRAAQAVVELAKEHPWLAQMEGMTTVGGEPVQMTGKFKAKGDNKSFTVRLDGEQYSFSTSPEVFNAVQSMTPAGQSIIGKILSIPKGILQAGATGLNPEFILRNLGRDTLTAAITSKDFTPGATTARGLRSAVKAEQSMYDYFAGGGGMETLLSADRMDMAGRTRDLINKGGAGKYLRDTLDLLGTLGNYSELSTRLGAYEAALKKTGSRTGAAVAGRESSIDFGRGGAWGKELNQAIPFFNAAIQGSSKIVRYAAENPKDFTRKGFAYVTLPSIALKAIFGDDDRIKDLPQGIKDMNWLIPVGDTVIRLPKPPGIGYIFGTIPERLIDAAIQRDPAIAKQLAKAFFRDVAPSVGFPGVQQAFEWAANYNMFQDRPIVSQRFANLPAPFQQDARTSEVAKRLGQTFDLSPLKIDNTIRGATAGLGRIVTDIIDAGMNPQKAAARNWQEMPMARGFVSKAGMTSQASQDFWDKYRDLEQKNTAHKQGLQRMQPQEKAEYERLKLTADKLREITKMENQIDKSKYSEQQKKAAKEKLHQRGIDIVRKTMQKK